MKNTFILIVAIVLLYALAANGGRKMSEYDSQRYAQEQMGNPLAEK